MHGYRAVHLVVEMDGFQVEIQVRTIAQNSWAQLSEDLAVRYGSDLKYELDEDASAKKRLLRDWLEERSEITARMEDIWARQDWIAEQRGQLFAEPDRPELETDLQSLEEERESLREQELEVDNRLGENNVRLAAIISGAEGLEE